MADSETAIRASCASGSSNQTHCWTSRRVGYHRLQSILIINLKRISSRGVGGKSNVAFWGKWEVRMTAKVWWRSFRRDWSHFQRKSWTCSSTFCFFAPLIIKSQTINVKREGTDCCVWRSQKMVSLWNNPVGHFMAPNIHVRNPCLPTT